MKHFIVLPGERQISERQVNLDSFQSMVLVLLYVVHKRKQMRPQKVPASTICQSWSDLMAVKSVSDNYYDYFTCKIRLIA